MKPNVPASLPPHLVFSTGGRWFGIPAEQSSEVVTFPALTRVPGAPPHLLGVFSHRGEIVPVVNFAMLVGVEAKPSWRAVLMRVPAGVVGLTVDQVVGVTPVSGKPEPLGKDGIEQHLSGPAQATDREVTLVNPQGLFDHLSRR